MQTGKTDESQCDPASCEKKSQDRECLPAESLQGIREALVEPMATRQTSVPSA